MNRPYSARPSRRPGRRLLAVVLLVPVVVFLGLALLRVGAVPEITIEPAYPAIGPSTPVDVRIVDPGSRGLAGHTLELVQGERAFTIQESSSEPRPFWSFWGGRTEEHSFTADLGRDAWPDLQPGEVTIRITAQRAPTLLRSPAATVVEKTLPVDLEPPTLSVRSERPVVRQGGSGAVVYAVDESAVRHGVRVGENVFPGAPLPGDAAAVFALYGAPHDLEPIKGRESVLVFAEDAVGNRIERPFLSRYDAYRFPADSIRLSDGFFADVLPEIFARTPSLGAASDDLLADYLRVNRDLRRENAAALANLAASTADQRLWRRPFEQLPSSRVMAVFGDHRTYLYEGEPVDEQTHLGYDLASNRHAEVPAAASGRVVLAEFFGIYGNTVVVDHGQGLQSLYSHLSEITVAPGDDVERGESVGRSGETGLAGGDHLHFSILIHGLFVDPIEWWDRAWIETRIAEPLGFELDG